jgi:FkbH-like protein
MQSAVDLSQSLDSSRLAALLAEVDAAPTIVNISRARRAVGNRAVEFAAVRLRLACLSSFTFEPLRDALLLQALRAGVAIEPYVAPIGQFDQELIQPDSGLARFAPDAVIIAITLPDVCPALYEEFGSLAPKTAHALVDDWMARLRSALRAFRQRHAARLFIQNYETPAWLALGLADRGAAVSQAAIIRRANEMLEALATEVSNAYVMNYDGLVAQEGRRRWADPRMALYARIPLAPANYWRLAGFYVRHLRPLLGLSRKVLVLDADNTLWGGIVGDVGVGGIALGPDFPGNAYVALQKRVLDLHRRGVVLCLASKNEPDSVREVFDHHPAMVLRAEHFSAMRVNWLPKHENVRAIARELNLGLDSFVFVDDSPVECDLMRSALPQVQSVCLPKEPAELPGAIETLDCFDQWHISDEDRERGALYRAEAGRRELQSAAPDMAAFYRQLQMRMTVAVDDPADAGRAAQMAARTNQFNMHTLRYTEDDVRRFMSADDAEVATLSLADRFGDNGVVGLAVVLKGPAAWTVRVLLLSCRVIGRSVEQCFVTWIALRARQAGAGRLVGEFVPTARNKPFENFYASCGFTLEAAEGELQRWTLPLGRADLTIPDWMTVVPRTRGVKQ